MSWQRCARSAARSQSFGMNWVGFHQRTKRRSMPTSRRCVVDGPPSRVHACTSCIPVGQGRSSADPLLPGLTGGPAATLGDRCRRRRPAATPLEQPPTRTVGAPPEVERGPQCLRPEGRPRRRVRRGQHQLVVLAPRQHVVPRRPRSHPALPASSSTPTPDASARCDDVHRRTRADTSMATPAPASRATRPSCSLATGRRWAARAAAAAFGGDAAVAPTDSRRPAAETRAVRSPAAGRRAGAGPAQRGGRRASARRP